MESNKVSVITPAYNCFDTIQRTFDSIKNQTYTNWEWIVVDDCSKDKTLEKLYEIAKNDSRVKVFSIKQNSGVAVARNFGIQSANGRYIAFLDSDDTWMPNKLEKQISFMQKKDIAFSSTNYKVAREGKKDIFYRPKKEVVTYKDLLKSCSIGCLTVIYDKDKIGKIYMPVDAPKREDHATWLDITKRGFCCYVINEPLAYYYLSDKSVSSRKMRMFRYQYIMYRKHLKFNVVKSFYLTFLVAFNKIFFKYH